MKHLILTKKSQMDTTVRLSILLIAAILLFTVLILITTDYGNKGATETCRTSVLTQKYTEVFGSSPISLECERRFIDIYPDHVELGYEPDKTKKINIYPNGKKISKYKELTNDIVNYVVAEEMRNCWYQFGEAKTEIFPNDESKLDIIGLSDDDICFICSEIRFIDVKNKEYEGLVDYLKNNYPKDAKYTYWDYFNQPSVSEYNMQEYLFSKGKNDMNKVWDNEIFKFKSEKIYAVTFYKDYDTVGKSEYQVLVMPTNKLDEICEILAS
ncbi:MAG: hypothetical protein KatS3mg002_0480 [Candidatus Woesearchaeota archaeon]|nr:MAG: hypothetical protein KatS3mg002_0480 [Candidatus Woesearchaeota archaeon]